MGLVITPSAPVNSPAFTGTPTAPTGGSGTQIATNTDISNAIAGVNPAVAVQVATNAILPNSPTYNNGVAGIGAFITTATLNTSLVIDGVTLGLLDRVLVKNESAGLGAAKNGVYYVSQIPTVALPWILIRALDYDTSSDMNNTGAIPVINGTVNALTQWVQSSQVTTVGIDAVTFTQFSLTPSATGTGLDVRQTSPTLITPLLGTVTSGNISACTSTSMVMVTPVLGTPTSGALTNCTSIPVAQATGLVPLANGGVNANLSATGGTSQFLKQASSGAAITVVQPAAADLSDTVDWTDYSSTTTVTGMSTGGAKVLFYSRVGNILFVRWNFTGTGTTTAMTFTLPCHVTNSAFPLYANEDAAVFNTAGVYDTVNSTTITCYFGVTAANWTASGARICKGQGFFQIISFP